jgi:ThiF family
MSLRLINRSPDLKKLRDEGYDIEIRCGHLLIKSVPYVNSGKQIKTGTLVSKLNLANDVTARPEDHVAFFEGEYPCDKDGARIARIENQSERKNLGTDLVIDHTFSAKPMNGAYEDYYAKMTTYVAILSGPAQAINPAATPKTFPLITAKEDESVFNYIDTASSRAEINVVSAKLELDKIAILGLGGTGAYVLDFTAKTHVKEIHLFDGDTFFQHNAFRSPGAASGADLEQKLPKTEYFRRLYSNMRRGIVSHPAYINASNIEELRQMNFVFLCFDAGKEKELVVESLEKWGIPFVDVGIGVYLAGESLGGIVKTTTSTPKQRDHVRTKNRISFSAGDGNNEYDRNIQIADLNALNAAFAVIKWKKLFGFYHDFENEHHCTYTIDGNKLVNEDQT